MVYRMERKQVELEIEPFPLEREEIGILERNKIKLILIIIWVSLVLPGKTGSL